MGDGHGSGSGSGSSGPRGRRPAITGIGPVAASGVGPGPFWDSLREGAAPDEAPLHDPRAEGLPVEPLPLRRVDAARVEQLLGSEPFASLPPDPELRLAAAAARLALEDAGLAGRDLRDAALVATWEAPGMDRLLRGLFQDIAGPRASTVSPEEAFLRFYDRHKEATYSTQSFIHLHVLARALGTRGHTLFLNNACASGLYALDAGAALIEAGRADAAVVVAAESPRFPTKPLWFREAGLHATDRCLRPFDRDRTGLVLGEGAAAVVLEPLDAARARGARAYAEYLGGGFNQEGWKVVVPSFAERFHEEAIRDALRRSGVEARAVDAIVAHGAGTSLSDAYEARGITAVFGERPERPLVTALKGRLGHTLGASALLESVALCLALERQDIPGTA
ncbi:MAG: hypothetical protein HY721_06700, partial [Planctomycetes bacterium]|nr:hypothetical protein [Planctomycetota bacterium]